jgi:hypothetical protein
MKLSVEGLELIKKFEGFRDHVYRDVAGFPTIGYGHPSNPMSHFPMASPSRGPPRFSQLMSNKPSRRSPGWSRSRSPRASSTRLSISALISAQAASPAQTSFEN